MLHRHGALVVKGGEVDPALVTGSGELAAGGK
jgi:hypothetical protein